MDEWKFMDQDAIAELYLIALCNWREAQNQTMAAKIAQLCSVRNRVKTPSWWGRDWISVITKPEQYSSFNANDPNSHKWPKPGDPSWADCWKVAELVYKDGINDTTAGATYYFDASLDDHPPTWATDGKLERTVVIDRFRFYRIKSVD